MNIVILNGSPRPNGHTTKFVKKFIEGAKLNNHNIMHHQVGLMKISGCIACEYCHSIGNGKCAITDDMQKIYNDLQVADMIIFASPVYYFGLTGQLQSTISRFYAVGKPQKVAKFGLILTSASSDVYDAIFDQYNKILDYFNAKDMGIITAYGTERDNDDKLLEVYDFGNRL